MSRAQPMFSSLAAPLALAVAAAFGCATAPLGDTSEPNEREGQILTREDIAGTGARDGWEALRLGGTYLNIQFPREGSDAHVTRRGVSSFVLSPEVLLVVDGTHMASLTALQDIRASNIEYMQILPARTAVVKYGTAGGNGAVVVKTGVPPSKRDTIPAVPFRKAGGGAG